jgi:hypothetical protein
LLYFISCLVAIAFLVIVKHTKLTIGLQRVIEVISVLILFICIFIPALVYAPLFMISDDFQSNLLALSAPEAILNEKFDPKLQLILLSLLSNFGKPFETLVMLWAIVPTLTVYSTVRFIRLYRHFYTQDHIFFILFSFTSAIYSLLFITKGFYGVLPIFNANQIPTSHLLFQCISSSFIFTAFLLRPDSFLRRCLIIIGLCLHSSLFIFVINSLKFLKKILSRFRLLRCRVNNIDPIIFSLFFAIASIGFLLVIMTAYSQYVSLRGSSFNLESDNFGVSSSESLFRLILTSLAALLSLAINVFSSSSRNAENIHTMPAYFCFNSTYSPSYSLKNLTVTSISNNFLWVAGATPLLILPIAVINYGITYRLIYPLYQLTPIITASLVLSVLNLLRKR